jgi:hypothetical protein
VQSADVRQLQLPGVGWCPFEQVAKVGLEAHTATPEQARNLHTSTRSTGAETGSVDISTTSDAVIPHPPSDALVAVLALLRQLSEADRAKLADALQAGRSNDSQRRRP